MIKAIYIFIAIAVILGVISFVTAKLASEGGDYACTQEAKVCPDGSAVGREGPNCEFAACPLGDI